MRTIVGVATSVAAFIDFFKRGPMNKAVQILSMADFERQFGGLDVRSEASYAIQQFYLNGGTEAWVVRVAAGTPAAARTLLQTGAGGPSLTVSAANEGGWGNNLRVYVDYDTTDPATRFNLQVLEVGTVDGRTVVVNQETFRNLSMTSTDANFVQTIVNASSNLVRVTPTAGAAMPVASGTMGGAVTLGGLPASPSVDITFRVGATPTTKINASLGAGAVSSLEDAAGRLQAAIRNANPTDPVWALATVKVVAGRLQITAGLSAPDAIIFFGPAASATVTALGLPTALGVPASPAVAGANAALYQLGVLAAITNTAQGAGAVGDDGLPPNATALVGSEAVDPPTGMFALNKVDIFNILCIPRVARVTGAGAFSTLEVDTVVSAATTYCEKRRAFFVLDSPSDRVNISQIKDWIATKATLRHKNLAVYFPRIMVADSLNDFRPRDFGASGTMAGVYARTDAARGVWKAPAGTEATLRGVSELQYKMTDSENGVLNPLAVNCLRSFDVFGNVSWGARTLDGNDQKASEWKYVPVRRLALFIEESLYQGTQWVVFEPNDEPLWSQIRLNVGAFMHNLFRQGAFQGQTPKDAYLVKCDKDTTTQNDINLGIVNILVGFAPLKPAEFVIIKIQQLAGQIQT
ncbi:MAG TPA: phage tail sheath C-terminal domain-containing protein [Pyrinomonadaceae bacterium]